MIHAFKKHPKYEAALGIVRAKITGAASNVLTNNKTPYNIIAIIKTLDSSYADKRPLYVVEAEMTSIKQLNKDLQQFHDAINEALHLVISKIVLDYKTESEQRALITEAQKKAVRTFVVGLRNQMMRQVLYSRTPGTLAEAFTIAQTVYYDHQYTQADQTYSQQKPNNQTKFHPITKQHSTEPQNTNKTEKKNDFKQENWRQPNQQQPYKNQKINQLQNDELQEINEDTITNDEFRMIPDELTSNSYHTSEAASVFLGE